MKRLSIECAGMKIVVVARVLDAKGNRIFGEGIAELLERIGETGSIAAAARAMGMAYSKAWRIIRNLEEALGRPALARVKGGRRRGGATLTPIAVQLVGLYGTLVADLRSGATSQRSRQLLRCLTRR